MQSLTSFARGINGQSPVHAMIQAPESATAPHSTIPKYARVLVVTDLSEDGDRAIAHAFAIAAPRGEVHLLNVIRHEEIPNPLYPHYMVDELATPEQRQRAMKRIEQNLLSRVPVDVAGKGIEVVASAVISPDIARSIVEEAHERKADVIVMGLHSKHSLGHLFSRSVAKAVLGVSELPVLLVRAR